MTTTKDLGVIICLIRRETTTESGKVERTLVLQDHQYNNSLHLKCDEEWRLNSQAGVEEFVMGVFKNIWRSDHTSP